ncbi:MAG: hypothetical protein AAF578_00445 [Pseudomonadota bacterium]
MIFLHPRATKPTIDRIKDCIEWQTKKRPNLLLTLHGNFYFEKPPLLTKEQLRGALAMELARLQEAT